MNPQRTLRIFDAHMPPLSGEMRAMRRGHSHLGAPRRRGARAAHRSRRAAAALPAPSETARASPIALLAFTLLSACSNVSEARPEHHLPEPPYRISAGAPDRLHVRPDLAAKLETTPAGSSDVQARLTGYGRLGFAADAAYSVRPPFPSYVERVLVGVGDRVTVGQPLAELRSSDLARLRAELSRNQVQVRVARQAVERLEPLVRDGTAAERELAEAQASLEVAEAELASVRQALAAVGSSGGGGDRYLLRAAAEGSVMRRGVAPGERVGPDGEPAFLIGDPERLVVRAAFPERDAPWLREGAPCSFTVQALGDEPLAGTVLRVLSAVDPRTRSVEALCRPDEHHDALRAEMLARVDVSVHGEDRILVPRDALLMKRDRWVVFVRADERTVERRFVVPGLSLGGHVQIAEGIAPGEHVIVRGAVLLDGELDVLL